MKMRILVCFLLLAGAAVAFSGGQSEAETSTVGGAIEIWNIWTAGGEAEAFQALLDGFNEKHPEIEIKVRDMAGGGELEQQLGVTFLGGNPPELFWTGPANNLKKYSDADRLAPVTDVWNKVDGDEVFPEDIHPLFRFDNEVWAIPLNMHTENAVWYNTKVFKQYNLQEPNSWDEYKNICKVLKDNGVAPTVGAGGWCIPYTIYPFIVEAGGIQAYMDFLNGKLSFTGQEMREAFSMYRDIHLANLIDDWSGYGWDEAARPFMEGAGGMYFAHGDWLAALLVSQGMPREDFNVFLPPAPGGKKAAVVIIDSFALTKDCRNPDLAKIFLQYCASVEGQMAFNSLKGSVAIDQQTPDEIYDSIMIKMKSILGDPNTTIVFDPGYIFPAEFLSTWEDLLVKYALNPTPTVMDEVLQELENARKKVRQEGKWVEW